MTVQEQAAKKKEKDRRRKGYGRKKATYSLSGSLALHTQGLKQLRSKKKIKKAQKRTQ